jgi:hypothetical protein
MRGPHHSLNSVPARRRAGGLAAPLRIVERSLPFIAANSAAISMSRRVK